MFRLFLSFIISYLVSQLIHNFIIFSSLFVDLHIVCKPKKHEDCALSFHTWEWPFVLWMRQTWPSINLWDHNSSPPPPKKDKNALEKMYASLRLKDLNFVPL